MNPVTLPSLDSSLGMDLQLPWAISESLTLKDWKFDRKKDSIVLYSNSFLSLSFFLFW